MLSNRCLSCRVLSCLSVLSVTLVYCGQTVGLIKMKLIGMEVGLGPGHIVLDGDPAPPPQKGHNRPNRLATTDMGRKLEVSAPFWGRGSWVPILTQCRLG